jgi:L-malate glycosyltransferase
MIKTRIIFVQLNNNYSGSPNVLANVINSLDRSKFSLSLITSFSSRGFLNELEDVNKINVHYKFYQNKILRFIFFCNFQILSAHKIFLNSKKGDIIYLNTFHPFLPAILGKLTNRKVIYHIHEYFPKPNLFQLFLFKIVELTSSNIICVSKCVTKQFQKVLYKVNVIYNSLSQDFLNNASDKKSELILPHKILMVSTLKEYKGVFMFCKIASSLKFYNFILIISENERLVKNAFSDFKDVSNLKILPLQTDLHDFYAESDLILNLTDYTKIIETFGLSILEAMYYGIPAIVPPGSGVTELVLNNYNGLIVDTLSHDDIVNSINSILNPLNYNEYSINSSNRFSNFSLNLFQEKINTILTL